MATKNKVTKRKPVKKKAEIVVMEETEVKNKPVVKGNDLAEVMNKSNHIPQPEKMVEEKLNNFTGKYIVIDGALQYRGLKPEGTVFTMPKDKARDLIAMGVIAPWVKELHESK